MLFFFTKVLAPREVKSIETTKKAFNLKMFKWIVNVHFQDHPDGEQSSHPKTSVSASGGGGPSASSKPSDTPNVSLTSPALKLHPVSSSAATKPSLVIKRPSYMESLMGTPKKTGDSTTHSTSYLTSKDLLSGPRPYQC